MPWDNSPAARLASAATYSDPEYIRNRRHARQRAAGRCERCGRRTQLQCDHITPVTQGGNHSLANLQMLCTTCHGRKTALEGSGARARHVPADPEPAPRTRW